MPSWSIYLLKFSISLSVIWIFYRVFLRRLTFYKWNRYYLIIYSLACFGIPLINIQPVLEHEQVGHSLILRYVPSVAYYSSTSQTLNLRAAGNQPVDWLPFVLPGVLLAGCFFLLLRLCIRFISFQRVTRKAIKINEGFPGIYHIDEDVSPFSFGNRIYVNRDRCTQNAWEEIILHEYIHVKQIHSFDILLSEFICILNWYNPFSWMMRHTIRQNLEFIADELVLESGLDRKVYQFHLLKITGSMPYPFVNSYNFSSLKKRIIMMNAERTTKKKLLRFVFLIPLLAVMLLAFRDKQSPKFAAEIDNSSYQLSGPITYVDEVSVENGIMLWKLSKYIPQEPVIFLDGKPLGKRILSEYEIHNTEFLMKGPLLQKYGLSKKQYLVNYITVKNKDNGEVHLFPASESLSPAAESYASAASLMLNAVYLDRETPLRISAEGLSPDKLEMTVRVTEGNGTVQYRYGIFYIKPSALGNIEVSVYKRDRSGHTETIGSRYFRVKDPAEK